jgi:Protein of unknown function (DUF3141)
VSEANLGLYRTFAAPWVRAVATEQTAEALREMHPHHVRFRVFSDENPFMLPVKAAAAEALLNIRRPDGTADERSFRMLKMIRDTRKANKRLTLSQFKELVKEQYQLVLLDEERAVEALPKLFHPGDTESDAALDALRALLTAPGPLAKEETNRVARVEKLLGVKLAKA